MRLVIGLGGNTGDVPAAFAAALRALAAVTRVESASWLWRSAPVGPVQADFLNAAALLDWRRHPVELLVRLHQLEAEAGRDRPHEPRWGPRPLDLDVLIARAAVIESPVLTVPHPRLAERRFALAPAAELVPAWRHPRLHRSVAELAEDAAVAGQRCERVEPLRW